MQVSLTGHHLDVTDPLKSYVDQKFAKLGKHYDKISQVHVILTVEKLEHKAEATVHLAGKEIFANTASEDMYAAIDGLVDKLIRQVEKHKGKRRGE